MPPAWAYGLSASSAVLWGFMPVLSRFIQTREPGSPSTPALLFCLCSVDAVLLGGFMAAQELRRRARFLRWVGTQLGVPEELWLTVMAMAMPWTVPREPEAAQQHESAVRRGGSRWRKRHVVLDSESD